MTTLPNNYQVTVTMTGKQVRALIDHADLTLDGPDLSDAEHAVLCLMGALQQAEAIHDQVQVTQGAVKDHRLGRRIPASSSGGTVAFCECGVKFFALHHYQITEAHQTHLRRVLRRVS